MKLADVTGTPPQAYGTAPKRNPAASPIVAKVAMDLSNLEAPRPAPELLRDTHFALGTHYPITDMVQVKVAADYFEDHVRHFMPHERKEYAYNLCKRAAQLGVPEYVGEQARRYGGDLSDDLANAKLAFHSRQEYLREPQHQELLDKVAEKLPYMAPSQRLGALAAIDKLAGLERLYDTHLADPFLALTEKWASEAPFSEEVNGEIILENELVFLAKSGMRELRKVFSDEVVHKMRANPVGTFKSLPREQKVLMARLAKAMNGHGDSTAVPLTDKAASDAQSFFLPPEEVKKASPRWMKEVRKGLVSASQVDPLLTSNSIPAIKEYRANVLMPKLPTDLKESVALMQRSRFDDSILPSKLKHEMKRVSDETQAPLSYLTMHPPLQGGFPGPPDFMTHLMEGRHPVIIAQQRRPNEFYRAKGSDMGPVMHELEEARLLHGSHEKGPGPGVPPASRAKAAPLLDSMTGHLGPSVYNQELMAIYNRPDMYAERMRLRNFPSDGLDAQAMKLEKQVGITPWAPKGNDTRAARAMTREVLRRGLSTGEQPLEISAAMGSAAQVNEQMNELVSQLRPTSMLHAHPDRPQTLDLTRLLPRY